MKKLTFIIFGLLLIWISGFAQNTAVIYSSDDPYSSCAAAIVQQKYSISYLLDVSATDADSAAQVTWIATLDSLTYAYILIDTTSLYTADRCQSSTYDSVYAYGLYDSVVFNYLVTTTSVTVCERAWDSLYSGIVPPLIVLYLSETDFCEDKFDAASGTDSTIVKTNATGWTNDAYNTAYTVYITAGTNIGASSDISDTRAVTAGNADTLDVTTKFSAAITSTSDAVIIKTSTYNRWGFYDQYAYYAVLITLDDIATYADGWEKLLDDNGKLNTRRSGQSASQDRDYLEDIITIGQNIFNYLIEIGN